jgi:hypothetical protein
MNKINNENSSRSMRWGNMHPIPQYLDDFNTNYIIFRNAEIFNNCFLQKQIVKQIEESFEIF